MTVLSALIALLGGHVFVYKATEPVERVNLAGTFNNWDKNATPMRRDADGVTWRVEVQLEPGIHYYKFVLDGERWIVDPKAKRNEDDGNGNVNSVLEILPADFDVPSSPTDDRIAASALRHQADNPDVNFDDGSLTFRLRVRPDDLCEVVWLPREGSETPMARVMDDGLYAWYAASVPWDGKRRVEYSFRVRSGATSRTFGPRGLTDSTEGNRFRLDPQRYRPFVVPSWVSGAVMYQIFPDRFENGDPSNDPDDVQPWDTEPTYFNRYGGDVAGIARRIDYLRELGVGCVYFNPVLAAPSNHRYDAEDHFRIDPQFGTNEEFRELVASLQRAGMRVVFDGVFNHVGVTFRPFADVVREGERSKYKDWFFIDSFPIRMADPPNYQAWWGFWSMPKLNVANAEVRAHLFRFARFWTREMGIDGWRLDVANEVPHDFWREFRTRVKTMSPEAWIVGEIWGDGSPWLDGTQFDSVMNYRFRELALNFVARRRSTPSDLYARLFALYRAHPPQVSRAMMNLLGSHDTPRILTECGGDERLAMLATTLQFAWVGAPSVYYGDELGMEGGRDPENRRGMRWDLVQPSNCMLAHYRNLIAARNASTALQTGEPLSLLIDDPAQTLAFARVAGQSVAVCVLNRSERARRVEVPLDALPSRPNPTDRISGRTGTLTSNRLIVELPPYGSALFTEASQRK